MLNPMLATVMLSRCAGFSWPRHLLVYWIGGLTGSVLAHLACSTVKAVNDFIDNMLYLTVQRLKSVFPLLFPSPAELAKPFIIIRILMTDLATFIAQLARPFLVLRRLTRNKS